MGCVANLILSFAGSIVNNGMDTMFVCYAIGKESNHKPKSGMYVLRRDCQAQQRSTSAFAVPFAHSSMLYAKPQCSSMLCTIPQCSSACCVQYQCSSRMLYNTPVPQQHVCTMLPRHVVYNIPVQHLSCGHRNIHYRLRESEN